MKKVIAFILASIIAFSLIGCQKKGGDLNINGQKDTQTSPVPETGTSQDSQVPSADDNASTDDSDPAVWTENTVVTEKMFVYFYNSYYRHFVETHKADLADIGLDPSKSLSEQLQSENCTWQQYMTVQVFDQLREMMALADGAKAAGITFTEEDTKNIANQMNTYSMYAMNSGMSVDTYLEKAYGKGVNAAAVESALELRLLANKYYEHIKSLCTFTDEECAEYYGENEEDFLHFNCISVTLPNEEVSALTAATDEESFIAALRDAVTKSYYEDDYDKFSEAIEAAVKRSYSYGNLIDRDSELGRWLLEEGRAPFNIYTEATGEENTTVTMLLPSADGEALYKNETITENFYYMVFKDGEGFESTTKAETIYKNWSEEPTLERFEKLCSQYGGSLAADVSVGGSTEALNEWIFDPARAAGDCSVIEGDGCTYLLYMLEEGDPAWLVEVRGFLASTALTEEIKALTDACSPEYNESYVYNVVEVSVKA